METVGQRPIARLISMIHARDLTKHYNDLKRGKFVAVDAINFDAHPGTNLRPSRAQRRWQDHNLTNVEYRSLPNIGKRKG